MKSKALKAQKEHWIPLAQARFDKICGIFKTLFPQAAYGDLADKIGAYWIEALKRVWHRKPVWLKEKDRSYNPADPLSRIENHTVLIAYADSVQRSGEPTLTTLETFIGRHFPAVRGLHLLPACKLVESRFNDGFFSQVRRNRIHSRFGSDRQFARIMAEYYAMADFVLNHVDIANPFFQAYLKGDDKAGRAFYVFSEKEFQRREKRGDFTGIFRPRPFPLFTIFRRRPRSPEYRNLRHSAKTSCINRIFKTHGLKRLPVPVIGLLTVFNKIKNDQMLLSEGNRHLERFCKFLQKYTIIKPAEIFQVSVTQETPFSGYIFKPAICTRAGLLAAIGLEPDLARRYARIYEEYDPLIYGEEIRALTTFSHVQVDLNTATFEGLKLLADDFAWYLTLDLNLLRLDAANFAFKKWGTTCFGLPETRTLMRILALSMECVAPRMVANLEVNDSLTTILAQMADKANPPPMMYDFHLAAMIPVVFNMQDARSLGRIGRLIRQVNIPAEQIRFSVVESHDGKSVRGSLDLLTDSERKILIDTVLENGGEIKYKSGANGTEPYELCAATRSALKRLSDPALEVRRYLAFYTLAFALMGRNVKSIYFNDLVGLPNDLARCQKTGEKRDIKRTRSELGALEQRLFDPATFERQIAREMNHLIALVDSDPALHFRGEEAEVLDPDRCGFPASIALVHNRCKEADTLVIVNVGLKSENLVVVPLFEGEGFGGEWHDNFSGRRFFFGSGKNERLELSPFERLWLTRKPVEIPPHLLVS